MAGKVCAVALGHRGAKEGARRWVSGSGFMDTRMCISYGGFVELGGPVSIVSGQSSACSKSATSWWEEPAGTAGLSSTCGAASTKFLKARTSLQSRHTPLLMGPAATSMIQWWQHTALCALSAGFGLASCCTISFYYPRVQALCFDPSVPGCSFSPGTPGAT